MAETAKRKREIWFVLFLCLLPFLLLGAAEIAGRAYIWWKHGVPGKTYGIYKADPELGGILAENSYNTMRAFNNRAFQRGPDTDPDGTDSRLRIVAYGGSTTFSYNLLMEDTWPLRLEALLRENGFDGAEVLNAGDVMWSLGHAYIRAQREIPELKPDYVILYAGINEAANYRRLRLNDGVDLAAALADGRHGLVNNDLMKANVLFRNSVVYKLFHHTITPAVLSLLSAEEEPPRAPVPPAVYENYRLVLRDFMDLITANGARCIFLVQAMATKKTEKEAADDERAASEILQNSFLASDFARRNKAIVLDAQDAVLAAGVPPKDLFSSTGVHYSKKGAEVLSRFVFENVDWQVRSR